MKSYRILSLFFYFLIIGLINSPVIGQQSSPDSIIYNRQLVLEPKNNDDLIKGYTFFRNHKEQSFRLKDTISTLYYLQMIAIAESELGAFHEAEETIAEALNLIDYNSSPSSFIEDKIRLNTELGIVYRALHDYDKALEVYEKTLSISHPSMDRISIINNMANVYRDQGKFNQAEEEYQKVYKERLLRNDLRRTARALNNLGSVQGKLNNPEGIKNMLEALEIRIAVEDVSGTFSSYNHLTDYYKDKNEIVKAKHYAVLGYEYANNYSPKYKLQALTNLLELSNDKLVVQYGKLNDSINTAKLLRDNKFAIAKYNVEKEQRKTLESELQREKQKRITLFYQSIGGFILVASGFLYFLLRSRFKKQKLKEIYETETRISKKVHDEVANDVYQVMTKIQGASTNSETLLDDLESIYVKTRDISKENSAVDVIHNFETTLNDLLLTYQNSNVSIVTRNSSKISWKQVSEAKKTTIYRVLQELMTNMRKHSDATLVLVSFQQENNKISITYSDNGKGCDLKKNNGLQNAENRIHTVKGTLIFESEKGNGFKVKMTL
ncbi:tetratricopeptide repeat-containing sensor histidine kinase [Ulvibacter antarcticus]|uniref:histidine kinase n=1 Tax=Ulvibacter antarcticus TaxID=442714 RepID=A0A3L9Z517_9FLAO|nr:tetratricopeptide repeat-containing sensor histidine kinase [Ulvibacter antarcticus]RMA66569.1 tetratricopeptide repeat protein [Ulvibacter antarcticus]